jgi:pilus assembly protein CpaE
MRAFVASDHAALSQQLRETLVRLGIDCPTSRIAPLELAVAALGFSSDVNRVARGSDLPVAGAPDLAIVVLSPHPERALGVVRELRRSGPPHLFAIGPTSDPKLILRTQREGADEYLDETDLQNEMQAALARLREQTATARRDARLIAVVSPCGGTGASTLAVNVATALAKRHGTCALLDLRLETGDLAALLDLKPSHTLADLCRNSGQLDWTVVEQTFAPHASGVHLLAAPNTLEDLPAVTPEAVGALLSIVRARFPYVVVDADQAYHPEQAPVICQADFVLLVLRLDFTALHNTRKTIDGLSRLGVDRDRVRLVANRFGQPNEVPAARAEEALGVKLFHYVPEDAKAVNRANNNGSPVVLDAPSAKVSRAVIALADSLNGA